MPELPEVERAATLLRAAAVGHTILRVVALHPAIGRTLTPSAIRNVVDRKIVSVERRAKHQLVLLDDGQIIEVHFKMTGDWAFGLEGDDDRLLERARITLDNGTRISLIDGRAFAIIRIHAAGELKLPDLGPEPDDPAFTGDSLHAAVQRKKTLPIKLALLDQRIVAGLGNIYVAEALWEARMNPTLKAASVSSARCRELVSAIRLVLERAPAERYYDRDGRSLTADTALSGMSDDAWRVYSREGEACPRCRTPIKRIVQGARSTFYCPKCQAR
ncbi:MAG: bifunctional DNA-formamidopyrimidine glycosylase/DNA-(apurinic or apyrimidinic site) lyase [Phycisphaerae bacterium]|nr:bifunctional DNA-formamidopyrimidine glycosylase/DNA-(apurinic or apyrimidinic site) lyase [Gemmatimonadaceae bacterium]